MSSAVLKPQESITIPNVWVAFAVSLVLHALLLWSWRPNEPTLPFEDAKKGKPTGSLAVNLAPQPSRRSEASPAQPPQPPLSTRSAAQPREPSPAKSAEKLQPAKPAARVLALEGAASAATPQAKPAPQPMGDFASYVEARRRARESASPPAPPSVPSVPSVRVESEQERANRMAAENLGLNRTQSIGAEKKLGGGIFQVQRMGYNDAEFFFYGFNKLIRRNARQMIEVRRGDNPTMEIAVVRKMIAIIREHTTEDFLWESQRLGREVALSARAADNAGLEDFMMSEFFADAVRRR